MPDLPEEAVQAAAPTPAEVITEAILSREWWDHEKAAHKFHTYDSGCAVCRGWVADMVREGLRALDMAGMVVVSAEDRQAMLGLLKELSDSEPCWFDHDGGCQAHGPTSTWPRCPHAHAREMLAALPERTENA